jgi:hypothetical protein
VPRVFRSILGLLGLAIIGCGEPPCPEGPPEGTVLRVTVVDEDDYWSSSCHRVQLEPGMIFELVTTKPYTTETPCRMRASEARELPDFPLAPGVVLSECRPGAGFGTECRISLEEGHGENCKAGISFSLALEKGIGPKGTDGPVEGSYRIWDTLNYSSFCEPPTRDCRDVWNVLVETVD